MHTKQYAPHNHTKLCPCPPPRPHGPPPLTPQNPTPPTLKLFRPILTKLRPPGSNQKTKIQGSIKIQFQVENCKILQKITPSNFTLLFVTSNPFQNGMRQPSSIKNCKVITFQAKGQNASQGLPVGSGRGYYPAKSYRAPT